MKKRATKSTGALAVRAEVLPPEAALSDAMDAALMRTKKTAPKAEIAACNALHSLVSGRAAEARKAAESACHYAVLLGCKLKALKEATPHGGWEGLFGGVKEQRSKGVEKLAGGSGAAAANLTRVRFEFSAKTAWCYMKAAEGALARPGLAAKAKKQILALAAKPEIPEALPATAEKALDAATRGETLRQLYIDLGVIRADATKLKGMGGHKPRKGKGGDEGEEVYRLLCEGLETVSDLIDTGDLGKLSPGHLAELELRLRSYLDEVLKLNRK